MDIEKKQIPDNNLMDSVYTASVFNWNFIILGILFLFLGFIINIPLKEKATDFITTSLASNNQCPIFFERLEMSTFLQQVDIDGPVISGQCLNRVNSLRFDTIKANLSWPTLSPPGLTIHLELIDDKSVINLYPVISYPKVSLQIKETKIEGPLLDKLMGGIFKLNGSFDINAKILMEKQNLLEGEFSLISKNLMIPFQTISGFNIPTLILRNFGLIGSIKEKNNIDVSSFTLGDVESMIFAQLSGNLKVNEHNFQDSKMNLSGKIRISKKFMETFPILNLLLAGKNAGPDGMYNLKLEGPLYSPKPSIF